MTEVEMIDVDSCDVLEMRDARRQDLLDEINRKNERPRLARLLTVTAVIGGFVPIYIFPGQITLFIATLLIASAYFGGRWLDSYKRTTVVFYDLEPEPQRAYEALITAFEDLAAARCIWHIPAGGRVDDLQTWKRNAGADHLVKRNVVAAGKGLPEVLRCNIDAPTIPVGVQTLYFFPDFLMIYSEGKVGAVSYADLKIGCEHGGFIEDNRVPADSEIVRLTWQFVNKKGDPDRRFKNNRELPVCLYETLHFQSLSGLNELVQFSRVGKGKALHAAVRSLSKLSGEQASIR